MVANNQCKHEIEKEREGQSSLSTQPNFRNRRLPLVSPDPKLTRDPMYANAPYTVIQRAMHIYPTVTELIPTMLGELEPLE